MLEEETGLGAPNLHPSGIVNSQVTDNPKLQGVYRAGAECPDCQEKNLKKNPKKPISD